MFTDPISDFLTRMRNASRARRKELTLRSSRLLKSIADVLVQKRFIEAADVDTTEKRTELKIALRTDREPLELKRMSKPGQRMYVGFEDIKRVRNGLGISIISTSQGVMSGDEARKAKLGGEYLCQVY